MKNKDDSIFSGRFLLATQLDGKKNHNLYDHKVGTACDL